MTTRRRGTITGSPFPFLNGMPNFLLDPGRTGGRTNPKPVPPPPQKVTIGDTRITAIGPTVQISANRHPCENRTTPQNLALWISNGLKLRAPIAAAAALYPLIRVWDGAPLLLHFGLESGWTLNAVSAPEGKAVDADRNVSTTSRSWGIGQVIDVNFPAIYAARNQADRVMAPPPSMDKAALQGADLSGPGRGLSGLHYAAQWLQNAAKAFANSQADPGAWPLLSYASKGLSLPIQRAIFLRLWAGGSSIKSVERRVPSSYFSIRPCADRALAALPASASWF